LDGGTKDQMSKLIEFLKKERILHLATINEKNTPHIVPVWYLYSSKKIMLEQTLKLKKQEILKIIKKLAFPLMLVSMHQIFLGLWEKELQNY